MNVLFYITGAIAVLAALLVITASSAARAVVYLVGVFLATAVVYYTIGAPFIAALQILIYAGAIIVLFVFALMILNLSDVAEAKERSLLKPAVWIIPIILALTLIAQFAGVFSGQRTVDSKPRTQVQTQARPAAPLAQVSAAAVGESLFTKFIIGVELASMLLLAALAAAFHLGLMHHGKENEHE